MRGSSGSSPTYRAIKPHKTRGKKLPFLVVKADPPFQPKQQRAAFVDDDAVHLFVAATCKADMVDHCRESQLGVDYGRLNPLQEETSGTKSPSLSTPASLTHKYLQAN